MITVDVRPMRAEDVGEVAALSARCFASSAWSAAELHAELERPFAEVWVAREREGAAIAGYAIGWFLGEAGELLTIGTDPEVRRRGLGRALIERVQASATQRSVRSLTLEVRRGNVAATSLYARSGFTVLDVRTAYYADGEDALVMEWLAT